MDYEKKYEEALERAKAGKPMDEVFPELKESEDERIRKEIVELIENNYGCLRTIRDKELALAYLEKQKEQKPFNDTQEYLKGVARVQGYDELTKFEKVFDRIADTYARGKNKDGYNEPWYTKERAAEMLYHAKEELGLSLEQKPAEWSEEDKYKVDVICKLIEHATIIPRSGDDDTGIPPTRLNDMYKGELKAFVKSLRPQPHWKPSKEQMNYLCAEVDEAKRKHNISVSGYPPARILESLYNDLSKL